MCGITGIFSFNLVGKVHMINLANAARSLSHRGPDNLGLYHDDIVGLGHARLAVIDTSHEANQPFWSGDGRYALLYNGEIYNFKSLRRELEEQGVAFRTQSDTEVLLSLYLQFGKACLSRLNGFYAFAIYDRQEQSLFLARDRMGIKPLYYYHDQDKFLFASELQAITEFGLEKEIDLNALHLYLQFNYVPAPLSMLKGVRKLMPGQCLHVTFEQVSCEDAPAPQSDPEGPDPLSPETSLFDLLETSVRERLVADVPLGSFLSGGVDSSVIAALAVRHRPDLHTFSVGYKDYRYFDETNYARKVARHIGSEHTVFNITRKGLAANLEPVLDHFDEPFADSSALAVYMLSSYVREHVTVALSGDGADELFGGYNKHRAMYRMQHRSLAEHASGLLLPFFYLMPKGRHNWLGNLMRMGYRMGKGYYMDPRERYWYWAAFNSEASAGRMLMNPAENPLGYRDVRKRIDKLLGSGSMNSILLADQAMVLPDDMLKKVDLMSMAHGLEVRVPFLDQRVVTWANNLPAERKVGKRQGKKILRDTFSDLLPADIFSRSKKGFEVPLLSLLRNELKNLIKDDLLSEDFIRSQGIFEVRETEKLKRKLFSINPGDTHARIWGLLVFQWWWKKHFL